MSTPPYGQPPYGQPPYGQPPYGQAAPTPMKPRPSAWWFALPVGLGLLAVAVGAFFLVTSVREFLRTDAVVPADGQGYVVTLPDTEKRMIWAPDAFPPPTCTVSDEATRTEVPLTSPLATYTRDTGTALRGVWTFQPPDTAVVVTCQGTGGYDVTVGPAPSAGRFAGGIVAGILIPLLLGGVAFVVLIVLVILFAVRGPRRPTS